ncbi:flavin reductase family protein [Candidatus Micrarchaeota archaeon]|nr:flavin reductase family protein [Candidatus Micrarchaeota archaeon]
MDVAYNDARLQALVHNVGLITTRGPAGDDVMAAEWTHVIAHEPCLVMVHVGKNTATAENISASKAFGANIAAENQDWVAKMVGGESGYDVDKVAALKELGVEFYPAEKIDGFMVKDAAANLECAVIDEMDVAGYRAFIGRVVALCGTRQEPLVYSQGKYFKRGERVQKPDQKTLDRAKKVFEKHRKNK